MFGQYPYNLFTKDVIASSIDEKGNPVQGQEIWTFVSKCRDEAKSARVKDAVAGIVHEITHTVLCPVDCPEVKAGIILEVRTDDGNARLTGKVVGFKRTQLHCRLWV